MIAAIIIATAISSSDVGLFFDAPSWMPTSATSYNTPGSDPGTKDGWYTHIVSTNWVERFTPFTCKCFCEDYYGHSSLESVSGRPKWDTSSFGAWQINEVGMPSSNVVVTSHEIISYPTGDETATQLAWECDGFGKWRGTEDEVYIYMTFLAEREASLVPVVTTNVIPRAARIDKNVMAGFLATFDGYYERLYYTLQGQSNVWDSASWGPRDNKIKFWFDPTDYHAEYNFGGGVRTNITARFAYWPEVDKLADHMLSCWGNRFRAFGDSRPGWCVAGSWNWSEPLLVTRMWFSSTADAWPSKIVPQCSSWTDADGFKDLDWSDCCVSFCALSNAVGDVVWDSPDPYQPLEDLMSVMSLTYGDLGDLHAEILEHNIVDIITNKFTHSDPWSITNDTKRLFSDRLCCMNQVMSLMDVTLYNPENEYGTNVLYSTCYASMGAQAVAKVSIQDDLGFYAVVNSGDVQRVSYRALTNRVETSTNACPVSGRRYTRIGKTQSEAGADVSDTLHIADVNDLTYSRLVGWTNGYFRLRFPNQQAHRSVFMPASYYVVIQDINGGGSWYDEVGIGFREYTNISVSVSIGRKYEHVRMVDGTIRLKATQPGRDAMSENRVFGVPTYGCVAGYRYARVPLAAMEPYTGERFYRTFSGSYSTHALLQKAVDTAADETTDSIYDLYDYPNVRSNPYDPIKIEAEELDSVIPTVHGKIPITIFCGDPTSASPDFKTVVCISDGYGHVTVEEGPSSFEYANAVIQGDLNATVPRYQETDPFIAEDRVEVMTRTVWDWKNVKRTDDGF